MKFGKQQIICILALIGIYLLVWSFAKFIEQQLPSEFSNGIDATPLFYSESEEAAEATLKLLETRKFNTKIHMHTD